MFFSQEELSVVDDISFNKCWMTIFTLMMISFYGTRFATVLWFRGQRSQCNVTSSCVTQHCYSCEHLITDTTVILISFALLMVTNVILQWWSWNVCQDCGHQMATKEQQRVHMKKDCVERPAWDHSCPFCGEDFPSKHSLAIHSCRWCKERPKHYHHLKFHFVNYCLSVVPNIYQNIF